MADPAARPPGHGGARDESKHDPVARVRAANGGGGVDCVFDCAGALAPREDIRPIIIV